MFESLHTLYFTELHDGKWDLHITACYIARVQEVWTMLLKVPNEGRNAL